MNMKRGLVFSLCALALAVCSSAQAQTPVVNLSLNLRYNDPADTTEGGTWALVARTTAVNGVAGISAYISNINTAGIVYGNGGTASASYPGSITATTLGAILNGGNPFAGTFGSAVNVVYGQDVAAGPIVTDIGNGAGTPGNIPNDPFKNATWNNSALIASGTFGASRPAFTTVGANSTDANVLGGTGTGTAAINADVTLTVRGDSVTPDGLKRGDANRDNIVNSDDFDRLALNFGTGTTWDQGDFNDSGSVNSDDFDQLALNFGTSRTPPAVAAVPEPASLALVAVGVCGLYFIRRKA
jgi:hypothetical protein